MIKPLKSRVVGELLAQATDSSMLWTPTAGKNVKQLLRITAIGDEVVDVKVGDVVVLPDTWSGAILEVYDDETEERDRLFVIDEKYILAVLTGV